MLKPSAPLAPPPADLPARLPPQPFFALGPQRVRLARERYFDQGQRPTGLVPEPVIQSWARCLSAHQRPQDAVAFDPVSRSRMHATLVRNRHLLLAAGDELQRLEATVGGTGCRVLLTDAEGVVVHATSGSGRANELLPIVSRVGVNLAEAAVGTNAPAVVLKTGQACAVSGAEHFFDSVHRLHCAAAPIRDACGAVAAVLDLTVEARPFGFDASALVGIVATAIENRLLQQGTDDQLVLQFQVAHSLLGSPLEALVGLTGQGQLAWANSTAQQLLGLSLQAHDQPPAAEVLFGQRLNELLALVNRDSPQACRLPNGLTVWMRAQGRGQAARPATLSPALPPSTAAAPARAEHTTTAVAAPVSDVLASAPSAGGAAAAPQADAAATAIRSAAAPPPARDTAADPGAMRPETAHGSGTESGPPAASLGTVAATPAVPPTLVDHQRELIDKVLAECQGNISRAARRLGVSRGLLYRRRRDAGQRAEGAAGRDMEDGGGD